MLHTEMSYDNKMAFLRLAVKATITLLMTWMLNSAHTAVFGLGMFVCCLLGSDYGVLRPSIDLFLFIGIAAVSKRVDESVGPHESMLDASVICLAAFYWVIGDIFRAALLGVWLPYQYLGVNRSRSWGYITLDVAVLMFPHAYHALCRAYRVYWPTVTAMLLSSINTTRSRVRPYAKKVMKSALSPAPISPSRSPPALSISAVVVSNNIQPSKEPTSTMVNQSTQTGPLNMTNSGTQWEEDTPNEFFYSAKVATADISMPAEYEMPLIGRQEPSRIRKQRLRDLARRRSRTRIPSFFSSSVPPVKSVMFAPISAPALAASALEPSISSPVPEVDSGSAPSTSFESGPIPVLIDIAADSPPSPPMNDADPVPSPSSPPKIAPLSVGVSDSADQNVAPTAVSTQEVLVSQPIHKVTRIPSPSSFLEPIPPPFLFSAPADDFSGASQIPALESELESELEPELESEPEPAPELELGLEQEPEPQTGFELGTASAVVPAHMLIPDIPALTVEFPPVTAEAWPVDIPFPTSVPEEMEVDIAIPFIEDFPMLPDFSPDGDEQMEDLPFTITAPITPPVIPLAASPIISPVIPQEALAAVDPIIEDPEDSMLVDEEPVLTTESPEVVMEEEEEQEEEEARKEDADKENRNEEEMVDVPEIPPFTPIAPTTSMITPPVTPIAFNMAPSPGTPKLDRRFIVDNSPTRPTCNIHSLDPNYKPPRKLDILPRIKEVYVEDFEDNDGYCQKPRWDLRGSPELDESELLQLELIMHDAADEASRDWPARQAGIEEQTAIDLAAKKERDKKRFEAKRKARVAAFLKRQQEKKEKGPSMFIQKKRA